MVIPSLGIYYIVELLDIPHTQSPEFKSTSVETRISNSIALQIYHQTVERWFWKTGIQTMERQRHQHCEPQKVPIEEKIWWEHLDLAVIGIYIYICIYEQTITLILDKLSWHTQMFQNSRQMAVDQEPTKRIPKWCFPYFLLLVESFQQQCAPSGKKKKRSSKPAVKPHPQTLGQLRLMAGSPGHRLANPCDPMVLLETSLCWMGFGKTWTCQGYKPWLPKFVEGDVQKPRNIMGT